jgi:hypothetical protein
MQKELAKEIEYKKTSQIANVDGNISIVLDAESQDKETDLDLKANLGFNSDFNMNTGDSDTTIDGKVNLKIKAPDIKETIPEAGDYQTIDADAKVNLVTKDKKLYFALKDFNLDSSTFNIDSDEEFKKNVDTFKAQIKKLKEDFVNKYAYVTIPDALIEGFNANKVTIDADAVKRLRETFETNKLFTLVSENKEAKGDYYEYVVTLNNDTLNSLFKDYMALFPSISGQLLDGDIDDIFTEESEKFVLKVNKRDKSDFILEYSKDDTSFKLKSSDKKLLIEFKVYEDHLIVDLNKKGDLYKGTVSVNGGDLTEEVKFNLEFKLNEKEVYVKLSTGDFSNDEFKVNKVEFTYDVKVKELSKFEATLPEEATSVDSFINAYLPFIMMGMGANAYGNPYMTPVQY